MSQRCENPVEFNIIYDWRIVYNKHHSNSSIHHEFIIEGSFENSYVRFESSEFSLIKIYIRIDFRIIHMFSGERFLCSICGKGFTQNSNLKQHLMRHNQSKPFKCVKCSANFVSKGELISHNRTHTGEHPFVCEVCATRFTTSSSLVIRVINAHSLKNCCKISMPITGKTSADS